MDYNFDCLMENLMTARLFDDNELMTECIQKVLDYENIKYVNYDNYDKILIESSREGNLEQVKLALFHDARVNTQDGLPLIEASKNRHYEVVKYLLENRGNAGIEHNKVLDAAVKNKDKEMINILIDNDKSRYKCELIDVFDYELRNDNVKDLEFILECKFDVEYYKMLYYASIRGNIEIMKLLMKYNLDISYSDYMSVIQNTTEQNAGVINLLDEYFTSRGKDQQNKKEMMLCQSYYNEYPLRTIKDNTPFVLKLYLEHGLVPNSELLTIALKKNIAIFKSLSENMCDNLSAAYDNSIRVINLLLSCGSNIVKQPYVSELLIKISKDKNIRVVRLLLENGADGNFKNGIILSRASEDNNLEIVKLLLRYCTINNRALYKAARKCNTEVVKLLLENGADINVVRKKFIRQLIKSDKSFIDSLSYENKEKLKMKGFS